MPREPRHVEDFPSTPPVGSTGCGSTDTSPLPTTASTRLLQLNTMTREDLMQLARKLSSQVHAKNAQIISLKSVLESVMESQGKEHCGDTPQSTTTSGVTPHRPKPGVPALGVSSGSTSTNTSPRLPPRENPALPPPSSTNTAPAPATTTTSSRRASWFDQIFSPTTTSGTGNATNHNQPTQTTTTEGSVFPLDLFHLSGPWSGASVAPPNTASSSPNSGSHPTTASTSQPSCYTQLMHCVEQISLLESQLQSAEQELRMKNDELAAAKAEAAGCAEASARHAEEAETLRARLHELHAEHIRAAAARHLRGGMGPEWERSSSASNNSSRRGSGAGSHERPSLRAERGPANEEVVEPQSLTEKKDETVRRSAPSSVANPDDDLVEEGSRTPNEVQFTITPRCRRDPLHTATAAGDVRCTPDQQEMTPQSTWSRREMENATEDLPDPQTDHPTPAPSCATPTAIVKVEKAGVTDASTRNSPSHELTPPTTTPVLSPRVEANHAPHLAVAPHDDTGARAITPTLESGGNHSISSRASSSTASESCRGYRSAAVDEERFIAYAAELGLQFQELYRQCDGLTQQNQKLRQKVEDLTLFKDSVLSELRAVDPENYVSG